MADITTQESSAVRQLTVSLTDFFNITENGEITAGGIMGVAKYRRVASLPTTIN